jgi:hypothetical protein
LLVLCGCRAPAAELPRPPSWAEVSIDAGDAGIPYEAASIETLGEYAPSASSDYGWSDASIATDYFACQTDFDCKAVQPACCKDGRIAVTATTARDYAREATCPDALHPCAATHVTEGRMPVCGMDRHCHMVPIVGLSCDSMVSYHSCPAGYSCRHPRIRIATDMPGQCVRGAEPGG